MTKTRLLFFLFYFALSLLVNGQTTIDSRNFFTSGKAYPIQYLTNIKKDTILYSGINSTWDFSNAILSGQKDTVFAMDPSATIFFNDPHTNYSLSDLCLFQPAGSSGTYDDNLYSYYISNASGVEFIGEWAYNGSWESWYYHMTDTEKCFQFPFSFNDNFQDTFHGSSYDMSGSGWHTFHGTNQVEADGFGTLLLPTQVYTNCLRIKSTLQFSDSSATFGVSNSVHLTYTWFQLSTNGPVFEIQTDPSYNIYNIASKYYYNNPMVDLKEDTKTADRVDIYPNPFTNSFIVTFPNPGNTKALFRLTDVSGNVIPMERSFNPGNSGTVTLHPGNLTAGFYFLEMNLNGVLTTKKIMKL
ncbi:MAG: T9SS type A sorting domain-containing protein [Bacteroidota bacterium]